MEMLIIAIVAVFVIPVVGYTVYVLWESQQDSERNWQDSKKLLRELEDSRYIPNEGAWKIEPVVGGYRVGKFLATGSGRNEGKGQYADLGRVFDTELDARATIEHLSKPAVMVP